MDDHARPVPDGAGPALVPGVHKALSSPVRTRAIALLRASDDGLGVAALAERLELHQNTVRTHLGVLEDAGLVTHERQPSDRPGRPRHVYRTTPRAEDVGRPDGYQFLARMLTGLVASSIHDHARASEEVGASWGRWLVETPPPDLQVGRTEGLRRLVRLMEESGFGPELEDGEAEPRLLLRRCPFLDLAREHEDVVCSIHLGLLRGAVDELGIDVEVSDLQPFTEPGLCVSHLRVPA